MTDNRRNRALDGLCVLSTRPQHQFEPFAQKLASLGAKAVSHPLVEIGEAADPQQVQQCLQRFSDFAIALFLSRHAAIEFARYQADIQETNEGSSRPVVGAIGPGTRQQLESHGVKVDFLPSQANSRSMSDCVIEKHKSLGGGRVLIIRADRGSDELSSRLSAAAIPLQELAIYRNLDVTSANKDVLEQLAQGCFDWVTITSSAIATNAAKLFSQSLGQTKVASISPQTTKAASDAGLGVDAEAISYNIDGLIEAIASHELECSRERSNEAANEFKIGE